MQEAFFLVARIWAGAYILSKAVDKGFRLQSVAEQMWRPSFIAGPMFRRAVGTLSLVEGIYAMFLIAGTDHFHLLTIASAAMVSLLTCYGTISTMRVGHCGCQLSDPAPKKERVARTALLLLRNLVLLTVIVLSLKLGTAPLTLISRRNDLGVAALALALLPVIYLLANKYWLQFEATVADRLRLGTSRTTRWQIATE